MPTACSVDCASAFLPLWQNCQDALDSSGAGSTFHDFAAMCGEAEAAGALSTCGYTELLPIIMACTDGTENFCTSSCYSRLRSYMHACYGVMPREASTFIASMESQMDQCNGMPGTSDRDLGASCDIYSIVNKCNAFGYEAIAGALRAEQAGGRQVHPRLAHLHAAHPKAGGRAALDEILDACWGQGRRRHLPRQPLLARRHPQRLQGDPRACAPQQVPCPSPFP